MRITKSGLIAAFSIAKVVSRMKVSESIKALKSSKVWMYTLSIYYNIAISGCGVWLLLREEAWPILGSMLILNGIQRTMTMASTLARWSKPGMEKDMEIVVENMDIFFE